MVTRGTHRNPWKAISSGIEKFKSFIRYKVGMGNSIRFWEDTWVGDTPLVSLYPQLYRISCNTNALIASIIHWNSFDSFSWDLEFRTNLNEREIEEFLELLGLVSLPNVSSTERDTRSWVGENRGYFLANLSYTCSSIHPWTLSLCPTNLYGKLVSLRR